MKKIYFLSSLLVISFFTCSINAQNYDSLADAVYTKDVKKINELLDLGIDINATPENFPSTVLFIACSFKGYEDIASLLISRGADVNFRRRDGKTPLMWAADNSLATTKVLLKSGADINVKANDGMTALLQCVFGILSKKVTTDVLDLLLKNGANINAALTGTDTPGWTALLFASINGDYNLAKYLIQHGANVNHTSDQGATALSLAKQEKYESIVQLLKKHGAKE